jgi:hypothetical protein
MVEILRIGDVRNALGNVLDQFDEGAEHTNADWAKSGSNPDVVTLTPDGQECEIEAVEPGEINVIFTAEDIVDGDGDFGGVQDIIAIRVLDASRFSFALSSLTNVARGQRVFEGLAYETLTPSSGTASFVLTATPLDELDKPGAPSATYAAALTNKSWSRIGDALSFNGSSTASGTLVVTMRLDKVGTSRITLTATNSLGETISASIDFLVRGAFKADAVITVEPE